jgi:cytoskeletal protein CcmA (bactofilin family)
MFFKKRNRIQNAIATLIGADTSIEGDVNFSGGLRVDGTINGNISEPNASPSTLILSEDGRVEGDVTASQLVINGKIIGTVKSKQFIELQAKAHIAGDVYYKSLEMHTGAVIEGKLVYLGENLQHQDASAI